MRLPSVSTAEDRLGFMSRQAIPVAVDIATPEPAATITLLGPRSHFPQHLQLPPHSGPADIRGKMLISILFSSGGPAH